MIKKTRRQFVYIVHPYRNDPDGNFKKVQDICTKLVREYPDVVPLAPQLMLRYLIHDETAEKSQPLAFELCRSLILRSNEVWVYNDGSDGCKEDIKFAMDMRIPVVLRC
jgi:hypothetical protein